MTQSTVRKLVHAGGVALAVLAILGGGAMGGAALLDHRGANAREAPEAAALPVDAMRVAQTDRYTVNREFSGRIVARRISDIAFEHGGVVREMLVDDGDVVAAGDVLARLGQRELEAERARLTADRARVAANLALAERTTQRRAALANQGHTSQQALDDSRFQQVALRAELDSLDAALQANQVRLDQAVLLAPFDGTVTGRQVDEGAVVQASHPVLRLVERGAAEVRVGVPAQLAGRMAIGDRHTVVIGGTDHDAIVTAVLPDLDMDTRTVTVVLTVAGDTAAPSGELAQLRLDETVATTGHWLPLTALTEGTRGLWTVYVLNPLAPDNHDAADTGEPLFEARNGVVEILHPEVDRVFVRGTLPPDALIVASGVHRLIGGQIVRLAAEDTGLDAQVAAAPED